VVISSIISMDKGIMNFDKALVTPKLYFLGLQLNVPNHVTRHFVEYIDDFLIVSFVDVDWNKLHSTVLTVDRIFAP
jgi:hypothetical protein